MMEAGKIYFLRRSDGLIKIGYTSSLKRRLESLTRSHGPLEIIRVINGDRKREKSLHHRFAKHNQFGEWFRDEAGLVGKIHALEGGAQVAVTKDAVRKAWLEGEAAMVAEARRYCERLIHARVQRTGASYTDATKAAANDHGFSFWTLEALYKGRSTSVTAYMLKRVREVLMEELVAQREDLIEQLAAVEAGESPDDTLGHVKIKKRRARA